MLADLAVSQGRCVASIEVPDWRDHQDREQAIRMLVNRALNFMLKMLSIFACVVCSAMKFGASLEQRLKM